MSETIVVVKRKKAVFGFAIPMKVWVDGALMAKSIKIGQIVQFAVPSGDHTIIAGTSQIDMGNSVTFNATGEKILFLAQPGMGKVSTAYSLTRVDDFAKFETIVPETIPLETVLDNEEGAKGYKASGGSSLNAFDLAEALERDITHIEEQMRILKPKIAEASKAGDNDSVSRHQASLGNYNKEITSRIKALKKLTGQRYRRSVSAWSMGRKPDLGAVILITIVFGAAGVTAALLTDIQVFIQIGMFGGLAVGFTLGHYAPVYNTGRKKTNLFLSVLLALVMGLGILGFFNTSTIMSLWIEENGLVPVFLFGGMIISFIALRFRMKPLIIVLSFVAVVCYASAVLSSAANIDIQGLIYEKTQTISEPAVITGYSFFYKSPREDYHNRINAINKGERITIVGKGSAKWLYVEYRGDKGWVLRENVQENYGKQ